MVYLSVRQHTYSDGTTDYFVVDQSGTQVAAFTNRRDARRYARQNSSRY